MYDTYIMRRTQIYLDDSQAIELARRARLRATTASKMIREAIDQYLADPDEAGEQLARYRTALEEGFGAAPYLADGAAYVDELRQADRSRDAELRRKPR